MWLQFYQTQTSFRDLLKDFHGKARNWGIQNYFEEEENGKKSVFSISKFYTVMMKTSAALG